MSSKDPTLIVIFGLPGTGKTTLAKHLSERLGIVHLNTDIIRSSTGKKGRYDPKIKTSVYEEMLQQAGTVLANGHSVIADGTFYKGELREKFKALAEKYKAGIKWIEVCAEAETVEKRLAKKRRYSEADFEVYHLISAAFEPMPEHYLKVYSDRETIPEMIEKVISYIEE